MFCVNDVVLYSCYGVCEITEISMKNFGGSKEEYYVLRPIYDSKSTLFVPVNNEKLTSKIRPVLTIDEVYALIKTMPDKESVWIEDENKRKDHYKEILTTGNREEIVKMIKAVYFMEKKKRSEGKKLHAVDEKFFRDAEKLLYEEFSHVLNIEKTEVFDFITSALGA